MATKEECLREREAFGEEWDGKFSIWGYAIGAAPSQYDEYGKLPRGGPRDFGFHLYTSDENDVSKVPDMWNGLVPIMVFVDTELDNDTE